MPEEPHGKFGCRYEGKPLTAKRWHAYRDCGNINTIPLTDHEGRHMPVIVELTDLMIELMGLEMCRNCARRVERLTLIDILAETLKDNHPGGNRDIGPRWEQYAEDVIAGLREQGITKLDLTEDT